MRLWGPLLGILLLLSLFIWWCRTDEACCDVEKPCLYHFGCKKYPKDCIDDQATSDDKDIRGSTLSLRSTKSNMTTIADVEDSGNDGNIDNPEEQELHGDAADLSAEKLEEKLDVPEEENITEQTID